MYYSIEMLKKCDWNLRKYLKEVAVRSYGLCIGLRDDSKDYTEKELKEYFLKIDKDHINSVKEKQRKPVEPEETKIQVDYTNELERAANSLSETAANIRDYQSVLMDVNLALSQVSEENEIIYKSLIQLKDNLTEELNSSKSLIEYWNKKLNQSYEDFRDVALANYNNACKRAEEALKEEDKWESHYNVYMKLVEDVNNLTL